MLRDVDLHYEVTTPLFCGGADPERDVDFRLPSFKGILRYWWRALAWSRYGGDLRTIRVKEEATFGSTSRVSQVRVAASQPNPRQLRQKGTLLQDHGHLVGVGVRYLGYGLMDAVTSRRSGREAGKLSRPCLAAPFGVDIRIHLAGTEPVDEGLLLSALKVVGMVAGLGARNRRGFGSLALRRFGVDGAPAVPFAASLDDFQSELREMLALCAEAEFPPYTAFSRHARAVLVRAERSTSPLALLDRIGQEFAQFRHSIDADDGPGRRLLARAAFGLPIGEGVAPAGDHLDRRASPLFLHIHTVGEDVVGLLTFLPAVFLPVGVRIAVQGTPVERRPDPEVYEPVHAFLDRLLQDQGKRFAAVCEVRP